MLHTTLIGHIGQDAKINEVNGRKVINFSVAHSERYKDANGVPTTRTTWVDCARWTDQTAIAQYLKKGTQVAVRGKVSAHLFTNREGKHNASLKLDVDYIELLSSQRQEEQAPQATAQPTPSFPAGTPAVAPSPVDDLPF